MRRHSSPGPIDPQIGGIAAQGVMISRTTVATDPVLAAIWQRILANYPRRRKPEVDRLVE